MADDLSDLTPEELLRRLADRKEELFRLRFQHATGQLSNYRRIGQVRKEVARTLTHIRQREIEAAEAQEIIR